MVCLIPLDSDFYGGFKRCPVFEQAGPDFRFHFSLKISLIQTVMFVVKNGSQTKVSQRLMFPRDDHVPGFEFLWDRGPDEMLT